ncbi:MAG: ABC transporter ATP-binding protein [Gemmataceae bacterium]|nr:ABC transporter ATP-binding protein [Gemmataceae bacterium]
MSTPLLEVRDLRKTFAATRALDGVSCHVEAGEIFGLLGPNGAGKTTLLSIVAGLLEADSGDVRIGGQPFGPRDLGLRRQIGIVPQELALYGELTAAENLRFFGELYGLGGADFERHLIDILRAVGLEDRAHHRVSTFSGGMQRRLNLGAALVHQPRLLLLDEPTAGVDPQSRNRLFEEIRRLHQGGMTIVYTSHYMEEVQALCSRIGIIDHGRLIACDTLPRLLQRLPGRIRFQAVSVRDELRGGLEQLDGVRLRLLDEATWELETDNVPHTVPRLLAICQQHGAELTRLETEEPNLEKVFLHLTGHGLRD